MADDDGKGRLRWRCRRGMKELDLLLTGYLDTRWADAGPPERAAFDAFLELPDPDIAGLLLGHVDPPAEFREILPGSATADAAARAAVRAPAPRPAPPVEVVVPSSPRAAVLAAATFLALPLLCLAAPSGPRVPASILCVAAALAGVRPVWRDLLGRGPGAVRWLRWEADGRFTVALEEGRRESCRIGRGSLSWGGGTWLVLVGPRRRRHVFLDASRVDPRALAALRCRLGREGRRATMMG